jgi:Icc-related predicted phosphoesterase
MQGWALGCSSYKAGKFILFEQNGNIHMRIDRTATEQIETDLKTGKFIRFSIKWINECEYELLLIDGNNDQVSFFRHRKLSIRITDVYADGYKFEGKLQGSNTVISNIMRVL